MRALSFQRTLLLTASLLIAAVCGANYPSIAQAQEPPETRAAQSAQTILFSGYKWYVRDSTGGPGPNTFDPRNVSVDANGDLHLTIAYRDGKWTCAEVWTKKRYGFGKYQFQVVGALDQFDPSIVLGLFNYPTPDVGPDGTNEIDIEFAQWGDANNPRGSYTVWPAQVGAKHRTHPFDFSLNDTYTTQRFTWSSKSILFQSLSGHRNNNRNEFARWVFQPKAYLKQISQSPMPVHINLWLERGNAPQNGQPVEIVIHKFAFAPE